MPRRPQFLQVDTDVREAQFFSVTAEAGDSEVSDFGDAFWRNPPGISQLS